MAQDDVAEVKKKGFFSRRKEAPAPAPSRAPAPAARPAARPAEPRISLESMPEVEKRIDRMHATARRQSLLERYENRYGEKLEVPRVFVSVEEEQAGVQPPAAPGPAAVAPKPPGPTPVAARPAAAPTVERPAAPATPSREARPAPAPRPAAAALAGRPAAALAPKPAPEPKPSKPSPINSTSFWKYFWNPLRFPLRNLGKYYYPANQGAIWGLTAVDAVMWPFLTLVRLFGPLEVGLILAFLKKRRSKLANGEKAELVTATN